MVLILKMHIMRKFIWFVATFFLSVGMYAQQVDLQTELEKLPGVVSVQSFDGHSFFENSYEIMVEQYLDHANHSAGKFQQRVFVSEYNKYSPVVFVTEGYVADYASRESYINELSNIVHANQVVVEHRYFGKSIPENAGWEYLTIENATADLHRIYTMLKKIFNYNNKWIATGISKGGQNTIAYKAFYPNDMDIWVSYVGPVNFAVEDKRMSDFLENVGSKSCRKKIEDFQLAVLKKRDSIEVWIDSLSTANKYTYAIPVAEVLDFCVLEYSFAFWQWGRECATIPSDTLPARELFTHLIEVSSPDYFSNEGTEPIKAFFVQAVKEFGYYGYDIRPFSDYLKIETAKNYIPRVFIPDVESMKFSKKTSKFINKTIKKDGENLILIYGEYDPWTGGALEESSRSKARWFIKPKGSHRTRIDNMSYAQQAKIYILLETLLEEE